MGKMSATEINTISEHVAGKLYAEVKEKAIARIENTSEKEFNKLAKEMQDEVEAFAKAEEKFKAFKKSWEEKVQGKFHNGKGLLIDYRNEVKTSAATDSVLFGKNYADYSAYGMGEKYTEILKLAKTKVVLANLGSELDVEKLIEELREAI